MAQLPPHPTKTTTTTRTTKKPGMEFILVGMLPGGETHPGVQTSFGFRHQQSFSVLLCPPPGDLPDPEIKPMSHTCPALAGGFFTTSTTWE